MQPVSRTLEALEGATLDDDLERRFDAFVSEYRERAVRIAWRMLGRDAAVAEDVAQEAFVRAHRGLSRFRGEARLSTWFYRILVNEVRRHQRWRALRWPLPGAAVDPDSQPDPASGRGASRPDPGLQRRIADALERLPRGQRETFVLVYLEELSLREAAEATGRAIGTMKSHLHRALRALRAELADLDPSQEDTHS